MVWHGQDFRRRLAPGVPAARHRARAAGRGPRGLAGHARSGAADHGHAARTPRTTNRGPLSSGFAAVHRISGPAARRLGDGHRGHRQHRGPLPADGQTGPRWYELGVDRRTHRRAAQAPRCPQTASRELGDARGRAAHGSRARPARLARASQHRATVRCRRGQRWPAVPGARTRRWRADRRILRRSQRRQRHACAPGITDRQGS